MGQPSIVRKAASRSRIFYRAQVCLLPIIQVSTKAWYKALERTGITDLRWHDLRHTWASWHVQQSTPLYVLQEPGGWESAEMVRKYVHLACEHLAPYADRLCALHVVDDPVYGTKTARPGKWKGCIAATLCFTSAPNKVTNWLRRNRLRVAPRVCAQMPLALAVALERAR